MNTKIQIPDGEIDLVEIIKKLWKEKILIIGLSLLFAALAYWIATLIPKKFEASVKINRVSSISFESFKSYTASNNVNNVNNVNVEFFDDFSEQLSSVTNFSDFIKNHSQTNNFTNYLKKNKISLEQYLTNNFSKKEINLRLKNQNQQVSEYIFIYPKEIVGHQILNEYVNYTAIQSYISFIDQIIIIINSKILKHEQALKIATSINLEETIPTSILKGNTGSILNEPGALYYKGAKVLRGEIYNLKQDLDNFTKMNVYNQIPNQKTINKKNISLLQQFNFNWDPILQQAIEPEKHISPKKSIFVLAGLFLGFFISLLVIFFRSQVLK